MEHLQLPAPDLPPIDMGKAMEELKCDVSIRQACCSLDAKIVNSLREKFQQQGGDSQHVVQELIKDVKKGAIQTKIQVAQYEFELSKGKVEGHTLQQHLAVAHLKLAAAEADVEHSQSVINHLKTHLDLDRSINDSVSIENSKLRSRVATLQTALEQRQKHCSQLRAQLVEALSSLEDREAEVEELQGKLQMDDKHAQSELSLMSQRLATVEERAKLAEETLRHRELLANERAQMQADMQHYSKDLAKMALETGTAANIKFQSSVSEMQEALDAERKARMAAEKRAAAAEANSAALEKEVSKLEKKVEAKQRRIAGLEEALQRETATPAGGRAVDAALDAVGAFVSQLGGSPESALPTRQRPMMPTLKATAGRSKDPDFDESAEKPKRTASKSKKAADKPPRARKAKAAELPPLEEGDEEEENNDNDMETTIGGAGKGSKKRRASKARAAATEQESDSEEEEEAGDEEKSKSKRQKKTAGSEAKENTEANTNALPGGKKSSLETLSSRILAPISANVAAPEEPLKPQAARPILGRPAPQAAAAGAGGKRRLLGVSSGMSLLGGGGDALPASKLFGNNFVVPKLQK